MGLYYMSRHFWIIFRTDDLVLGYTTHAPRTLKWTGHLSRILEKLTVSSGEIFPGLTN